MATAPDLSTTLQNLTHSLTTTLPALPTRQTIVPHPAGLTLLTTKNELLLSYLQHLVFLILVKIRNIPTNPSTAEAEAEAEAKAETEAPSHADEAIKQLVHLRVHLERGVRPLESRLKYQIDKVLRAADAATSTDASHHTRKPSKHAKPRKQRDSGSGSDSGSSNSSPSSPADSSEDEVTYRPNIAALARTSRDGPAKPTGSGESGGGVYRPPRITPVAPPTTTSHDPDGRDARQGRRKPLRSTAVDDYINDEMSAAPSFEPSVGSTIAQGGRRSRTVREREREEERRAYEEANFVRLPREGKEGRRGKDGFGGGMEELRGLGAGAERIGVATGKRRAGKGVEDRVGGGRKKRRTGR